MDSETIQNAIHDPTPGAASEIMSEITPDLVSDIMPSIFGFTINGGNSSEVAEQTVDQILTVVETKFLGDAVDLALDQFGQRIVDMLTGTTMLSIFERVALMMVNGTAT